MERIGLILDNISEGIIVIDKKGIITSYNNRAKDIFGLFQSKIVKHSSGNIKVGDLVFIVDNKVGGDDGNLSYEELKMLNINNDQLKEGDSLLAFGIYKDKSQVASYRIVEKEKQRGLISLKGEYENLIFQLEIDFMAKVLTIKVNGNNYSISYETAAGHMLIMRRNKLVFCQQRGYTARNEALGTILRGGYFEEKGENARELNPIGKFLFNIHERNEEMDSFYKCATGADRTIINEFMNINGVATLSSIIPLYIKGEKVGAMLRVEDVTELKKVIEERNILLRSIKEKESILEEDEILKSFTAFEGISRYIRATKLIAYKSSKTNSTVLILGESGIGKSTLAKEIHNLSLRKNGRFLHINCTSLPESLLESELFGYEGGSFTNSKKSGKFGLLELAHGGTVFLDEIGELSLKIQAKLLNFLQSRSFYRVGGIEEIKVDTRIICATNKNLEEAILKGDFREDLYYRINIIPIYIEPLRNRFEDIPIIVETLIPRISSRLGKKNIIITSEAMKKLNHYNWPGNIRELENVLERAISLSDSEIIYSKNIQLKITSNDDEDKVALGGSTLKGALEEAEKEIIIEAIKRNKGQGKTIIKELNIGKTSFYEKIKKYNIKLEDYKEFYN